MTDEQALWVRVHDGDANAMLVLADLWEEEGRPAAAGLRWLARENRRPRPTARGSWIWVDGDLPEPAVQILRESLGNRHWLHDSFVAATTAAAEALAESNPA